MNKIIKLGEYFNFLIANKLKNQRFKKTNNVDGVLFNLLYCQLNKSQDSIIADMNHLNANLLKNKLHFTRQAIINRNNQFSVDYFKNIYDNISRYIDINFYKNNNEYTVFAVDGTDCNLRSKLNEKQFALNKNENSITALNIGIYNVTKNSPVILELVKHKNERKAFVDFINNTNNYSNNIFLFDRGFYSENLINVLYKKQMNFVCRLKKNSLLIKENLNDNYVNINNNQLRIVSYKINKNKYYMATNLPATDFDIDKIKQLYHQRWAIEEFFKYIKSNFNFSNINILNEDNIRKLIYNELIIAKITEVIIKYNKKKIKENFIVNKHLLSDGLFKHFLPLFVHNKLNNKNIKSFMTNYISIIKSNKNNSNPRICVRPYKKWYYKQYQNKYKNDTLENQLENNINETLKTQFENNKNIVHNKFIVCL